MVTSPYERKILARDVKTPKQRKNLRPQNNLTSMFIIYVTYLITPSKFIRHKIVPRSMIKYLKTFTGQKKRVLQMFERNKINMPDWPITFQKIPKYVKITLLVRYVYIYMHVQDFSAWFRVLHVDEKQSSNCDSNSID